VGVGGRGRVHLPPLVRGPGTLGPRDLKWPPGARTQWHLGHHDLKWSSGAGTWFGVQDLK
jgi:hypothetical protein